MKFRYPVVISIFLFLLIQIGYAQKDSLIKAYLTASNDTIKLRVLLKLTRALRNTEPQLAEKYAIEQLVIAKKLKNKNVEGMAYNSLGNFCYLKADFPCAHENFLLALKIFEESRNDTMISGACMNMGIVNETTGNFDEALLCYEKALNLRLKLNMKEEIPAIYNNIANVFTRKHENQEGLKYYRMSLAANKKLVNPRKDIEGQCYSNISVIYFNENNFDSAKFYLNKSLNLKKEINDTQGLAMDLYQLGSIHLSENNLSGVEQKFKEALQIATENNFLDIKKNIFNGFSEYYFKRANYKLAYDYLLKAKLLNDSIFNEKNTRIINEVQEKYKNEKSEKEIAEQKLEIEKQNTILARQESERYLLISSIGLLLVFLVALYGRFYLKRRANRQLEKLNIQLAFEKQKSELKALLAQMNPHFINNCMNSIQSFILENDKRSANEHLTKFATLMRLVLEHSDKPLIKLSKELEALQLYIDLEILRFQNKFTCSIVIEEGVDAHEICIPPLIIQPYIENSIKHGKLSAHGRGKIILNISRGATLKIIIDDNGVGMKESQKGMKATMHHSMGTKITADRIKLLNFDKAIEDPIKVIDKGEIGLGENGTRVEIMLPIITC